MVNQKYVLLNESLKALSDGSINLLIEKGAAGFSKSYSTIKFLEDKKIDYGFIQSYATPLKFYELLYKYKDKKVIVFDDVQSINNPLIVGMLKNCCWSVIHKKRQVAYYTTSESFAKLKIPEIFDFKANIILIFNNDLREFAPVINRGVKIDLNFSFDEKIEIFKDIQKEAEIDQEVLDYIIKFCDPATKNLSIRTMVILSKLKRNGYDFKMFAREILPFSEEQRAIVEGMKRKKWIETFGRSQATYYRSKARLS